MDLSNRHRLHSTTLKHSFKRSARHSRPDPAYLVSQAVKATSEIKCLWPLFGSLDYASFYRRRLSIV